MKKSSETNGSRAVARFMIITSNTFKDADNHIESLGYKTEEDKLKYVQNLFHTDDDSSFGNIKDYKTLLVTIMKAKRGQGREQL